MCKEEEYSEAETDALEPMADTRSEEGGHASVYPRSDVPVVIACQWKVNAVSGEC